MSTMSTVQSANAAERASHATFSPDTTTHFWEAETFPEVTLAEDTALGATVLGHTVVVTIAIDLIAVCVSIYERAICECKHHDF